MASIQLRYSVHLLATVLFSTVKQQERIKKAEALSFLLTYIVVHQGHTLSLNSLSLFKLTRIAEQATDEINASEDAVPHEIIESVANIYLKQK